jgi:squalene synthase HpnC
VARVQPEALLARARAENFPVALRVLPATVRRDLLAIYAYARLVDELGDEAPGDRLALLDALEQELDLLYRGQARHPVLRALAPAVRERSLPPKPFRDLIEANRQDQHVHRYATFEELQGYCRLSANPVGQLVLHVFDAVSADNVRDSDSVCTALQVIEHCQDVAEDFRRGRVYLPLADMDACGCSVDDLAAARTTPALRALVAFELQRAAGMLDDGAALLGRLRGWARLAVLGFVAGGAAAIDGCRRVGFDVLAGTPRTRRRDLVLRMAGRAWRLYGRPEVPS